MIVSCSPTAQHWCLLRNKSPVTSLFSVICLHFTHFADYKTFLASKIAFKMIFFNLLKYLWHNNQFSKVKIYIYIIQYFWNKQDAASNNPSKVGWMELRFKGEVLTSTYTLNTSIIITDGNRGEQTRNVVNDCLLKVTDVAAAFQHRQKQHLVSSQALNVVVVSWWVCTLTKLNCCCFN